MFRLPLQKRGYVVKYHRHSTMSVPKKKRVSKKNKISWRKHVNIADVESFLEEKRLEERLGKPVTEKADEELFHVDVGPGTRELSTKQKRRMLLRQQEPKCFSMLKPHTEVADPVIKRNRVKTQEERKNELVKRKEKNRIRNGILKAKELQSLKDKKLYEQRRTNKPKCGDVTEDIWSSEVIENNLLTTGWIANNTKKHVLAGSNKLVKTVPISVRKKKSVLPSVEIPHPGTSYNPSFMDHQELLQEVAQKESKIIKEEAHLIRVTRSAFSKVTPEQKNNDWLTEMGEGLLNNNEENIEEQEDKDYKAVNPPVQNKKKNLKQRRKQKEQLQLEQTRNIAKKEKKKVADIYKLRMLKVQLDKSEKKAEALRAIRLKKEKLKEKEPKRLGALKFEEEEITINMPQDISGNLRNLKKEGSLLLDRFKSFQKRNVVQPSVKQNRTRAKVKRFKRSGHKDDWKVTVARSNK